MAIIRKSILEFDKWEDYKNAIRALIDRGIYRELVEIHNRDGGMFHRMHGSMLGVVGYNRFLPWHRSYLIKFETEIRSVSNDKDFAIPYWDWTRDTVEQLKNFKEIVGTSTLPRRINLNTNNHTNFFSETSLIDLINRNAGDYFDFSKALEDGPHNRGHNLIGGAMSTMRSPADPIFWSHHAMVDKVWADWQALPGNKNKMANLDEVDNDFKLDPWDLEFNIKNVNDIQNLGENGRYTYSYKIANKILEPMPLRPDSPSSL